MKTPKSYAGEFNSIYPVLRRNLPLDYSEFQALETTETLLGQFKDIRQEKSALNTLTKKLHYIDIETNKAGHFYLLGKQINNKFDQYFLDPRFEGASKKTGIPVTDVQSTIKHFLEGVRQSGGAIVAYSNAELETFQRLSGNLNNSSLNNIPYINLLGAAKKWIKKYKRMEFEALPPFRKNLDPFRQKRMRYSLASVMRLTDFKAPPDYAPGKTTSRFNTVGLALERQHQDFSQLTNVQKAKMTKVLKHNLFDVKAMPVLFELILETDPNCFKKAIQFLT